MVFRQQIGKRPFGSGVRAHKTNQVIRGRVGRFIRRQLIRDGLILNPATRPPRYQFEWAIGGLVGTVYADDRSKARSLIKKDIGIPARKRLPTNIIITRSNNIEYQKALNQTHVNLQTSARPNK